MKTIRVKLSPEAEEVYQHLNREAPDSKTERMILKAVNQKVELIELYVCSHPADPCSPDDGFRFLPLLETDRGH